jgi:hypothetical protein
MIQELFGQTLSGHAVCPVRADIVGKVEGLAAWKIVEKALTSLIDTNCQSKSI